MKKIVLLSALICAPLAAMADGTVSYPNGWTLNYEGDADDAAIVSVANAGSGNLDMTAPTESVVVTAICSNAFSGCGALHNITLPASLEQFEEGATLFSGQFIGQSGVKQHIDCGNFAANPNITVEFEMTAGDAINSPYNQWGSPIFCFGSNPTPEWWELGGIIQLYWASADNGDAEDGHLLVATGSGKFISDAAVTAPFSVHFEISGGHVIVSGVNSDNNVILFGGKEQLELTNYTINAFNQFSYGMGTGMTANVTIVNNNPRRATPFVNTALESVAVAPENTHMNVTDGALFYANEATPAFRPLTALGGCFTIANADGQYFYANTVHNAAGVLNTTGDYERRVNVAAMANNIVPATLFKINNITDNGYKISGLNSDEMEFGGKADSHNNLDVCVSQWSAGYLSTFLGNDTYILTTSGYTLSAVDGQAVTMDANADISQPQYHLTIKSATEIPLAVNDERYAATVLPVAVSIPSMTHAYKVVGNDGTAAKLQEITGTIPANTPFVIYESSSTLIELPVVAEAAADAADAASLLKGYPTRVNGLPANGFFAFNAASKAFVKSGATAVGIGVPYILASDLTGLADSDASLTLPADPTTAIREVQAAESASPRNVIYDLQGRKVTKATRGLYIINGVKTLVK